MLKITQFSGVFLAALVCCATQGQSRELNSFLKMDEAVDNVMILPPPPEFDSVRFLADKAAHDKAFTLRNTKRWEQARIDSEHRGEAMLNAFAEVFGISLGKKETPETYTLLSRLSDDMGYVAVQSVREKYKRIRPFVFYNERSCQSEDAEKEMKTAEFSGSYPSGHAATGWAIASVLAEIRPDRANELLKRGYEYSYSRVICGAHWQSDVDAGRIAASAYFSVLRNNEKFMQQLAKAKKEIKDLVAKNTKNN